MDTDLFTLSLSKRALRVFLQSARSAGNPGELLAVGLAQVQGGVALKPRLKVCPTVIKASVVILTWNSTQMLSACLASLPQGFAAHPYEVIVVDNGSRGLTPVTLRKEFPWMRLAVHRKNRGVAPARNQGIRVAQGEYIILLDDDTVVQPGAFDRLIAYMDTYPETGLCAPKLIDPHGQLYLSCRLFPTLSDKLARRLSSTLALEVAREVEMADWDHGSVREVDYVIGACQVIRRAALAEVGLLDERIFYGPEDVDLCLRMRQTGWQVVYNPEAVIVHKERRVTRSLFSPLAWRHFWGLVYFFWKHGYLRSRRHLYARLRNQRLAVSPMGTSCGRPPPSALDHLMHPEEDPG